MKKLRNSLSSLAAPAVVAVAILFSVCSAKAEWVFDGMGSNTNTGAPGGTWKTVSASGSTFTFNQVQSGTTYRVVEGVLYRDTTLYSSLSIVLQAKAYGSVTLAEGDSITAATDYLTITFADSTQTNTKTINLTYSSDSIPGYTNNEYTFSNTSEMGQPTVNSLTPDTPGYLTFVVDSSIYEGTGMFSITVADHLVVTTALGATVDLSSLETDVKVGTNSSGSFETEHWVDEVPEPGTLSLVLLGLGGVLAVRRRWAAQKG